MASAAPKTESPTDNGGEITASPPTPPAGSDRSSFHSLGPCVPGVHACGSVHMSEEDYVRLKKSAAAVKKIGQILETLPTDIGGEVTEFPQAPPAISVLYMGAFDTEVDTALKEFGLVSLAIGNSYRLYAQEEDGASHAHFKKLLSQEGESQARSNHVEPFEAMVIGSFAALTDFLKKEKERSVCGVHDKFVVLIHHPTSRDTVIIDVRNEFDGPILKKILGWMKKKLTGKYKSLPQGEDWHFELVLLLCIGFLAIPNATVGGLSWAKQFVECSKIVALACTVAAFGMRNNERMQSLSRGMIKAGAIATASGIIMAVAMPLQLAVGLLVGLVGWAIVVAVVLVT